MKVDIYNTDKKYNIIYADPPWSYGDKQLSWSSYGNSIAYTYNLDILFDLIQAGLVEKVEG